MQIEDRQRTREILRRTTSLMSSGETLIRFLTNVQQTSAQSPVLQSQAVVTSELVSLMTEALRVLQFAINRSSWTGASTELENWRAHWRTALENFEIQTNLDLPPDLFDDY